MALRASTTSTVTLDEHGSSPLVRKRINSGPCPINQHPSKATIIQELQLSPDSNEKLCKHSTDIQDINSQSTDICSADEDDTAPLYLYTYDELPEWLQYNKYITTGYRVQLSMKRCFKSFFHIHNETGNCWTHFIAFIVFMGITFYTLFEYLDVQPESGASYSVSELFAKLSTFGMDHLIFFVFLLAAQVCFLCSTGYHLFMCHSQKTMVKVARLDYCGISALITGSFFPAIYYGYYCFPFWQVSYLLAISVLGLIGMLGPMFDFYHRDSFSTFRLVLFAGTTLSGLVPAIHNTYLPILEFPLPGILSLDEIHSRVFLMYILYGIGFVLYVTKFPECFFPGKFDTWCSSHQLWHVFVFAATVAHYMNCLNIYNRWMVQKDQCDTMYNLYYNM